MYADYISLVVEAYQRKLKENTLAPRLMNPTPAKLRDECLAVCQQRYLRQDEKTLELFFGKASGQEAYLAIIVKLDIDKFKPLANYLKGQTSETEEKNIELLAWLIDFNPRPFEVGKRYDLKEEIADAAPTPNVAKGKESSLKDQVPSPLQAMPNDENEDKAEKNFKYKSKRSIIALSVVGLLLAAAALAGIFWKKGTKQPVFALTGHESCMYWAEDHFEQVSCSQKVEGAFVIALDSAKMHDFKKITRPDTITYNAIGHVWYCKINNKVEYYTADGNHPIRNDLRLRPITRYMIDKHIRSDASPE